MTGFNRGRGEGWAPSAPPGSATDSNSCSHLIPNQLSWQSMSLNISEQGRIQDFPSGGGHKPSLEGGVNSDTVLFDENMCKRKELGMARGGGGAPETFVCRSATGEGPAGMGSNPRGFPKRNFVNFHKMNR